MSSHSEVEEALDGIAIVGISGRFPGARTLDQFWENLKNGVESIRFFTDDELLAAGVDPALLQDPRYVKASPVLEGVEGFDASFFGINAREAEWMDPQHRMFLEAAHEALENGGYDPERYDGRIGVYGGASVSSYLLNNLMTHRDMLASNAGFQAMLIHGTGNDYLATRVSYKLNLKGPSVAMQTACSTSLVAVHAACQSLMSYQCDMALAGGVSVKAPQEEGYVYAEGSIFSSDGHCRAFAADANGTVFGSGVGIVLLKRLEDAVADGDTIHAVIKGAAINNDGSVKVGYTAPSVQGQAEVIAEALALADVDPATISYVEAHGTGTSLGDPIEIEALTQAYRAETDRTGYCAIGSVKSNIGHLNAAAGISGLLKTVLALKHGQLPPSLHADKPNPKIDFASSPFFVNTELREWQTDGAPRRAGVSSFGIGGTNAHVVLEEAPEQDASSPSRAAQLLLLSAKTPSALEQATVNLAQHLQANPDANLADVAYTLQVGRREFQHRRIVVADSAADAAAALEPLDPRRVFSSSQAQAGRSVVFMFPGQGSQYANMAKDLYDQEPVFRAEVDACADLLRKHLGLDLRDLLYPSPDKAEEATEQLKQTNLTQPAIFVIEYAMAKQLIAWGITPRAVIGHSIGEYVAATLAGTFALPDALALVAARGRLIQSLPGGAMLTVGLTEGDVQPHLGDDLSLAAVNSANSCVVAGTHETVEALETRLAEKGVSTRRLHTSHAFHSHMMAPILDAFRDLVQSVTLNAPQMTVISNVSGTRLTEAQATDPSYWVQHLRQTVRFHDGIQALWSEQDHLLLEVGPGQTLSTLARQQAGSERVVLNTLRHPNEKQSDLAFLLHALGRLWMAGVGIDWSAFYADEQRRRVPLPTYPFEHRRYWIEPKKGLALGGAGVADAVAGELAQAFEQTAAAAEAISSVHQRPNVSTAYVAPRDELEEVIAELWTELLGFKEVGVYDSFFDLGGHSLLATQLLTRLREMFPIDLQLTALFEEPTIAKLAELIEDAMLDQMDDLPDED